MFSTQVRAVREMGLYTLGTLRNIKESGHFTRCPFLFGRVVNNAYFA
jgi:hypothetical protein